MSIYLTLCNCPNEAVAMMLAKTLVDEGLAACVNVLPCMQSVYRWQGAVQVESEVQVQIKSSAAVLTALAARIKALHPYELPEIISVEVTSGLDGYLRWVESSCRDQGF